MKLRAIMPPDYTAIAILLIIALHFFLPIREVIPYPWRLAAIALIVGAFILGIYAVRQFLLGGTPLQPFSKPSSLLERGPFRFSRNPIYLAGLLIVLGVAILFGSASGFLVPVGYLLIINSLFVVREERLLLQRFGSDYQDYCNRTRRWL